MVDVRLPDGRVITNVPDGITKSQLMAKLSKLDTPQKDSGGGLMENLQAFGKGASMGLLPKVQALGMTAIDQIQNPEIPLSQSYWDAKQAAGQLTEGANPLSEIAGGIISPVGNKALAGMKGASLAQKVVKGAKSGAMMGVAYGAGDLENDVLTGDPSAVLKNAAVGGGIGFAAPAVGAGLSAAGQKIGNKLSDAFAPGIAPEAAKTAQQFNIPLTLDQVAGGRMLGYIKRKYQKYRGFYVIK
jgi:hypothetical protein